ncbi:MAG: S1/P1 nuclease [Pyrinomonadaceae bacterium]
MSHIPRILVLVVFSTLLSAAAFAWDETGHKITAYIAWKQMKPEVREKVIELMLKAPENSDLGKIFDSYNSRSDAAKKLELFLYAASWPDYIKNRNYKVRYSTYNHGDWHYSDIFWKQMDRKAEILKNFPVESGKANAKLADFEKTLRDPKSPDAEKAIAIAWFIHVAGDIHQPLHNASRVTDSEKEGDQGGNMFVLRERTEKDFGVNLHSYWDSIVSRVDSRKDDECDPDYIKPIAESFSKKYGFSKFNNSLELGKYDKWNQEGFAFLNSDVYTADLKRGSMPSKKYEKNAFKLARKQMALAGYRIGETFNGIFGK